VSVEEVGQPDEIEQGARQPVELIDEHDVDQPSLDIAKQLLESRTMRIGTGTATVVVMTGDLYPASVLLASHVRGADGALALERSDLLAGGRLETLARVDCAALDDFRHLCLLGLGGDD
jgi:hypothetical protein